MASGERCWRASRSTRGHAFNNWNVPLPTGSKNPEAVFSSLSFCNRHCRALKTGARPIGAEHIGAGGRLRGRTLRRVDNQRQCQDCRQDCAHGTLHVSRQSSMTPRPCSVNLGRPAHTTVSFLELSSVASANKSFPQLELDTPDSTFLSVSSPRFQ
jgi:hypothetical protein